MPTAIAATKARATMSPLPPPSSPTPSPTKLPHQLSTTASLLTSLARCITSRFFQLRRTLLVPPRSRSSGTTRRIGTFSFFFIITPSLQTNILSRPFIESTNHLCPTSCSSPCTLQTGPGRPLLPPLLPPDHLYETRPHSPSGWGSGVGSQASRAITLAVSRRRGRSGPAFRALARFCLPRKMPSKVPRRVPRLTDTRQGTLCGTRQGTLRGTRVHVDAGYTA